MRKEYNALSYSERVSASLRALYKKYGYKSYKMGKFEEYDLYSRNKDFLTGEGVITFTDRNGKLMALKPDVTLSIVKNVDIPAGIVRKLFYNENVYRVSKGTGAYKEILQTGLECLGALDPYSVGEVLLLACESLALFGDRFVLDVSHVGLVAAFVSAVTDDSGTEERIFKCVSEKNAHGIREICEETSLSEERCAPLLRLLALNGAPKEIRKEVCALAAKVGRRAQEEAKELFAALSVFEGSVYEDRVRVDFSVVSNRSYYNGVVFSGFLEGAPGSVLFGGQYDRLMEKMQKKARAVGFAVYLDELSFLAPRAAGFDADILLIYKPGEEPAAVRRALEALTGSGKSVFASATEPVGFRYKKRAKLIDGEVIFDG